MQVLILDQTQPRPFPALCAKAFFLPRTEPLPTEPLPRDHHSKWPIGLALRRVPKVGSLSTTFNKDAKKLNNEHWLNWEITDDDLARKIDFFF